MSKELTAKRLAEELNGGGYCDCPTKGQAARAKEAGLLIVYGGSDDLMEFSGAWEDEVDCYSGGDFVFGKAGLPDTPNGCDNARTCSLYKKHITEKFPHKIKAKWCDANEPGNPSWSYKTEIPHVTFEIWDGDELYCRGLVIDVNDLHGPKKTEEPEALTKLDKLEAFLSDTSTDSKEETIRSLQEQSVDVEAFCDRIRRIVSEAQKRLERLSK